MLNLAAIDENKDLITKEYVDGKLIPSGGTSGQVLAKSSGTDYDVGWTTPSGSGQRSTTVLYDNPSGSNGNITLSQSAANFDYLKIYTFNTDGINGNQSFEVYKPNGKYVFLSNVYTNQSHAWTQGRCVYINGTSISTYVSSYGNFYGVAQVDGSATFSASNFIYIYRVEAWNDEIMNVTLPLSIANGGSGDNETKTHATVADIITAGSGITISAANFARWGKIGMLQLAFSKSTATATGANITIGTVKEGYRPIYAASAGGTRFAGWLTNAGNFTCTNYGANITANTTVYISTTYILP